MINRLEIYRNKQSKGQYELTLPLSNIKINNIMLDLRSWNSQDKRRSFQSSLIRLNFKENISKVSRHSRHRVATSI